MVLLAAAWWGCDASPLSSGGGPLQPALPQERVTGNGRLAVVMPSDLTVHLFSDAIAGTASDASYRVFVGYRPVEELARLLGPTKEVLLARGWRLDGEQHFERASMLRLVRGAKGDVARVMWLLTRRHGVVVCDAIAGSAQVGRLGERHQSFCKSIRLRPPMNAGVVPASADTTP
jgi:hypothetical protein